MTTPAIAPTVPASRFAVRFGRSRDLVGVDSLAEASALVTRFVDRLIAAGKCSSAFPKVRVLDGSTLKAVANVSWNGRVWPPGTFTSEMQPLFDPGAEAAREIEASEPDSPESAEKQDLSVVGDHALIRASDGEPAGTENTMSKKQKKTKKPAAAKPATAKAPRTPRAKKEQARDPRLPAPGTVIERVYKSKTLKIEVLDRGFRWDGREWRSSTALAKEITGAKAISGPRFLGYDQPAEKPSAKDVEK